MHGDIYVVKTSIFGPAFQIKQQTSIQGVSWQNDIFKMAEKGTKMN